MGVTCVVEYKVPIGLSGQQAIEQLQQRVEKMGAVKVGQFSVDCDSYTAVQHNVNKFVHILHNSDQPTTTFAIQDNHCLIADTLFDILMLKLKDYYSSRKNPKIESRGPQYEFDDFVIKLGSVVMGQNSTFKGILIEIEYSPCVVASDCMTLLNEFMAGFLDKSISHSSQYIKSRLHDTYKPADTMMQYIELFNMLRKTVGSNVATTPVPTGPNIPANAAMTFQKQQFGK